MGGGGSKNIHSVKQDLRGKHFIVTGANTGIGYANARELAKMGAKVTIACRSESKGRAALEKIRQEALETPVKEGVPLQEGLDDVDVNLELLDLGSLKSVIDFAKRFRRSNTQVDVLVNNAGIMAIPERQETVDGFELQFGVNYFGPHLLTRLLEPNIKDGGRVIFVSSLGHIKPPGFPKTTLDWDNINFEKPGSYERWSAYGRSKLGNVLDAKNFATRLAPRGITTYSVHPGGVDTELTRNLTDDSFMARLSRVIAPFTSIIFNSPLTGSLTQLKCSIDPDLGKAELSGRYWADMYEEKPNPIALDPATAPRYWKVTEDMLEAKLGKKIDELILE